MPLAKFQMVSPGFFIQRYIYFGSIAASSPMVVIPRSLNFFSVRLPTIKRSPTGRGHIFTGISSLKRGWTRSGFVKSDATFARSLLKLTPILTVKPNSLEIRSRISSACFKCSPGGPMYCAKSSSMEKRWIKGVYSEIKSTMDWLAFIYRLY